MSMIRCPTAIRASVRCIPFTATAVRSNARAARHVRVFAASEDEAQKLKAMEEAMQNPEVAAKVKALEEQMANPEVQQQMAQMQALMSSPQYLAKMAELREDPELKPIFDKIREGGMAAMMQYMNDPEFLKKIGDKMGNLEEMAAAAPPPIPAVAQEAPIVNNILDAAKYGDVEAVEDYMAIGKGDLRDENQRTALHYAVAYNQGAAAKALLDNGADTNAVDEGGNTPLIYAAGYGREGAVRALVDAGADITLKNQDGQNAVDVIKMEPRNPLNNNEELLKLLGA